LTPCRFNQQLKIISLINIIGHEIQIGSHCSETFFLDQQKKKLFLQKNALPFSFLHFFIKVQYSGHVIIVKTPYFPLNFSIFIQFFVEIIEKKI
jgi:hypothetical protein